MELEEEKKAIEQLNIELLHLKLMEERNKRAKNEIILKHCTIIGKDLISI